ncbi:MAG: FG-GAP repeat domain-containing protein [Planctomycetota bacterium]
MSTGLSAQQFSALPLDDLPWREESTRVVLLADVDNDKDPDLVVTGSQDRLYLNDGAGRFRDVTSTNLPAGPNVALGAVAADVDGDGDRDLVFALGGSSNYLQNRLYLNDGKGRFSDATAQRMPALKSQSTAVAAADLDGDGDRDLVFANGGWTWPETNRYYLNDGKGYFKTVRAFGDTDLTLSVACGDVDGNGAPDVVFGNSPARRSNPPNRLLLNNGKAVFSVTNLVSARNLATNATVLADTDGDSDLDLVFGNGGRLELFENRGRGWFVDVTSLRPPSIVGSVLAVSAGDLDGDGDNDLLYALDSGTRGDGLKHVLLNNGKGQFSKTPVGFFPKSYARTWSLAVADVDSDRDLDVISGNMENYPQNRLFVNLGKARFVDASRPRMPVDGVNPGALASGDLDGDGDLELVAGAAGIYFNDGQGGFGAPTTGRLPVSTIPANSILLVDVDGDRDLDLFLAQAMQGTNSLVLNDGKANFTRASGRLPNTKFWTHAMAAADVDADGDSDLAFGEAGSTLRLLMNNGSGWFTDSSKLPPVPPQDVQALVFADVDRDRDPDLITGSGTFYGNGLVRLLENDGKGAYKEVTAGRIPAQPRADCRAIASGDVDGDKDIDLVLSLGAQIRLYLNDGRGRFSDVTKTHVPAVSSNTFGIVLDDFDEDGDLDLFLANPSYTNLLYVNDGKGKFTDASSTRVVGAFRESYGVTSADFDGDGDLDIVTADRWAPLLLLNLLRQTSLRYNARIGSDFVFRVHASDGFAPAGQWALPMLSTTGGPSVPIPPYGGFRLGLAGLLMLPPTPLPAKLGRVEISIPVPNVASFRGRTVWSQALVLPTLAQSSWRFTNALAEQFRF